MNEDIECYLNHVILAIIEITAGQFVDPTQHDLKLLGNSVAPTQSKLVSPKPP